MLKKDGVDYFTILCSLAENSCAAAGKLCDILKGFDPGGIESYIEELRGIARFGKYKRRALVKSLEREFITPVERGDIMDLARRIGDVTDSVASALASVYMPGIQRIRPDALKLSRLAESCCGGVLKIMRELPGYKKSRAVWAAAAGVNRLIEEADALYSSAMRGLYSGRGGAGEIIAWIGIYGSLAGCCKACGRAADTVERVIIKNT